MQILDYLKNAEEWIRVDENSNVHFQPTLDARSFQVEYRLLCSGMLYPAHFVGDWSHSDVARILLRLPVDLLVASQPYEAYPQELALRFFVRDVTETVGRVHRTSLPDGEIASDLAALLTVLCRRLITVSAKLRQRHHASAGTKTLEEYPIPVVTTVGLSHWKPRSPAFPLFCTFRHNSMFKRPN
jgi:hypothetical protein